MTHGTRYRTRRAGLGGLAVVTAALMGLSACGNPVARITTERAISNAVGAVASQSHVDLQISLAVSAKQLLQISGGSLTPKTANTIVSSSIIVDFNTGNGEALSSSKVQTDRANQLEFGLETGSTRALEIRYVAQTLYARVDIRTLFADIGESGSVAGFLRGLQTANAYVKGITALGNGRWVSVSESDLAPLLGGLKAKVPATTNPASAQTFIQQLRHAFTSNATYTNVGTRGGRTEYVVTVGARNFVQQVTAALPASISGLLGASSSAQALNGIAGKVPANQRVLVDLWVRNNKAQEIDIDLNQFVHEYPFAVPLRILIGAGAPVSAPSGATRLDLSGLTGLLGGLLAPTTHVSGVTSSPVRAS